MTGTDANATAGSGASEPRLSRRDAAVRARNLTRAEAHANSEAARAALVSALNALEDRVNVPRRAKARAQEFARESPGAAIAIGVVAAAAVGGIVWLLVRRAVKG